MNGRTSMALALTAAAWSCAAHAHAHFVLTKPASWLNEDELGTPQKGSPCGPGNTRPFIGDDVQPVPVSNAVTTFHAGETIDVEWKETVYHAGYFRISLAKVAAAEATSADFPDPALTDTENCHYDRAAVQTGAHDNVLADGLFMAAEELGDNRSLSQKVTLPNEPCEHCTLQVVQVMEGHPASSCFYFHCAEITILPAEGSAGAGGADSASAGSGAQAGSAAPKPPSAKSEDDGGCAIARPGAARAALAAWCSLALAGWLLRRRARASAR